MERATVLDSESNCSGSLALRYGEGKSAVYPSGFSMGSGILVCWWLLCACMHACIALKSI